MKTLLRTLLALVLSAAVALAALAPWEPIVVNLVGAPHPKARVTAVSPALGTFSFAWLNAAGERVDSGNSVGRFSPRESYPSAEELAAAIVAAAQ